MDTAVDLDLPPAVVETPMNLKLAPTAVLVRSCFDLNPHPQDIFPFLKLPLELRYEIYEYAMFPDQGIIILRYFDPFQARIVSGCRIAVRILLLNRQVYSETIPFLQKNQFSIPEHLIKKFSTKTTMDYRSFAPFTNVTRVRLWLGADYTTSTYSKRVKFVRRLPSLKHLTIVFCVYPGSDRLFWLGSPFTEEEIEKRYGGIGRMMGRLASEINVCFSLEDSWLPGEVEIEPLHALAPIATTWLSNKYNRRGTTSPNQTTEQHIGAASNHVCSGTNVPNKSFARKKSLKNRAVDAALSTEDIHSDESKVVDHPLDELGITLCKRRMLYAACN